MNEIRMDMSVEGVDLEFLLPYLDSVPRDFEPGLDLDICHSLSRFAQAKEYDKFDKVVDALGTYVTKWNERYGNSGEQPEGTLEHIARGSARIDYDMDFVRPGPEHKSLSGLYKDPTMYGPTMKALAQHLDIEQGPAMYEHVFGSS